MSRVLERCARGLLWLGAATLVVLALWVTYGAFMRYALRSPDELVTDGTALMLLPLAFLALPYASQVDAFPAARGLVNRLPASAKRWFDVLNVVLLSAIGVFYSVAGVHATWRSLVEDSRSYTNEWPIAPFWALFAVSATCFSLQTIARALTGRKAG